MLNKTNVNLDYKAYVKEEDSRFDFQRSIKFRLSKENWSPQDPLPVQHSSTAARPPASLMAAVEAECRNNQIGRCSRGTRTHWNTRSVRESGDLHEHSWRCGRRCGNLCYYSCYSWSSPVFKVTLSSSQLSWKETKKAGDGFGFIFTIYKWYSISGK